ncbi:MAG: class I SAM-dependent methyltransferase [Gemmatimonadales bacterium]
MREDFWEDPERVEEFASRPPDRRLLELLDAYDDPGSVRVLDLGCAGGRNTVVLAERGFDFQAIDASEAMVRKTRERVEFLLGREEASCRVQLGRMEDLGRFASGSFDLVVALGIYHGAESQTGWDRTIEETVRVLVPGGQLLVASFSPRTDPKGEGLRIVPGTSHTYEGTDSGPLYLLEAEEMDAGMLRHGLVPVVSTETVGVATELGHRITVNALYRKS